MRGSAGERTFLKLDDLATPATKRSDAVRLHPSLVILAVILTGCASDEPTSRQQRADVSLLFPTIQALDYDGETRSRICAAPGPLPGPCHSASRGVNATMQVNEEGARVLRIAGNITWQAERDVGQQMVARLELRGKAGGWTNLVPREFAVQGKTSPLVFDWDVSEVEDPEFMSPLVAGITVDAYAESGSPAHGARLYVAQTFIANLSVTIVTSQPTA